MLSSIRKYIHGWLSWLFLTIIAIVFIFWGSVGLRIGGERYVDVNGEKLYPREIDLFKRIYPNADLVQITLAKQRLNNIGFNAFDSQLDEILQGSPYFQVGGKFSEEVFNETLKRRPLELVMIRTGIEFNYLVQQLSFSLQKAQTVFPMTIERYYNLMDQKRTVSTLTVENQKYINNIEISDQEIENYYESNKNKFKSPAKVKLDYIKISYSDILNNIKIPRDKIKNYYELNRAQFKVPSKKKLSQIVINKSNGDKLKEVQELLKNKDSNFSNLASKYSDDIITAKNNGSIGWFQAGELGQDKLNRAYNDLTKVGDISDLIEINNKYYILKLDQEEKAYTLSLDDVSDDIKSRLSQEIANDKYSELKEQLERTSYEISDSLTIVAEELNLQKSTSDYITKNNTNNNNNKDSNDSSNIASNPKVIDAAFSNDVFEERNNSSLIELSPDSSVVIRIADYVPEKIKDLSEVKAEIKNILKQQKAKLKAKEVVNNIWQDFIDNGASVNKLEKLSKKHKNVKYLKPNEISYLDTFWSRNESNPDSSLKTELLEAFSLPKPNNNYPLQAKVLDLENGDKAILAINNVKLGDYSKANDQEKMQAANQFKYFLMMRDNANFFSQLDKNKDKIKSYL